MDLMVFLKEPFREGEREIISNGLHWDRGPLYCGNHAPLEEKGVGGGFKARMTSGPSNLYGDTLRRPLVSTDGHKFETLHNMAMDQAEEAEVLFVLERLRRDSLDFVFFALYKVFTFPGKSCH